MNAPSKAYDRESQILVVEDDGEILKFLKIHLNRYFAKITAVSDSNTAIKSIKERDFDLIISDYNLPHFNGYELWQRTKHHDPSVGFLMITGAVIPVEQEDLLRRTDGFLRKPFSVEKLHDFIKAELAKCHLKRELADLLLDKQRLTSLLASPDQFASLVEVPKQPAARQLLAKLRKL